MGIVSAYLIQHGLVRHRCSATTKKENKENRGIRTATTAMLPLLDDPVPEDIRQHVGLLLVSADDVHRANHHLKKKRKGEKRQIRENVLYYVPRPTHKSQNTTDSNPHIVYIQATTPITQLSTPVLRKHKQSSLTCTTM